MKGRWPSKKKKNFNKQLNSTDEEEDHFIELQDDYSTSQSESTWDRYEVYAEDSKSTLLNKSSTKQSIDSLQRMEGDSRYSNIFWDMF